MRNQGLKVYEPPKQFKDGFNSFIASLAPRELKENTIYKYRRDLTFMLQACLNLGATKWSDITMDIVSAAFKASSDKGGFRSTAKVFFPHLVKIGLVSTDFAAVLPIVRTPKKVPSVFTKDEIDELLSSIDRKTNSGKLHYAVILLALRLGLRNSDIRLLEFRNVDFENNFIDFTQFKTSVPHRLILPTEVKEALLDYINNGRPKSEYQIIFLGSVKPHKPFRVSGITNLVNKCFAKTNIEANGRHLGPHALRSTFASELIAEKVPYDAVRIILGHTNPESTRYYTKMGIDDLRTCALEVPPPTGCFAKYLAGGRA